MLVHNANWSFLLLGCEPSQRVQQLPEQTMLKEQAIGFVFEEKGSWTWMMLGAHWVCC